MQLHVGCDALERAKVGVEQHAAITARVHGGVAESKLVRVRVRAGFGVGVRVGLGVS